MCGSFQVLAHNIMGLCDIKKINTLALYFYELQDRLEHCSRLGLESPMSRLDLPASSNSCSYTSQHPQNHMHLTSIEHTVKIGHTKKKKVSIVSSHYPYVSIGLSCSKWWGQLIRKSMELRTSVFTFNLLYRRLKLSPNSPINSLSSVTKLIRLHVNTKI